MTLLRYFRYNHLPEKLQSISKLCQRLAVEVDSLLPDSEEKAIGLRKLLEAKDCFVRAELDENAEIEFKEFLVKEGIISSPCEYTTNSIKKP